MQRRPIDREEMAARIPGWGADLDPKDRPAVPMEAPPKDGTGAHWSEPERQVPEVKIHKSTEHPRLTATFGTSCPPRGLSGLIRNLAYRYSEGRMAHWLLLMFADRVDVVESAMGELLRGRPPNVLKEMGLKSELTSGHRFARFSRRRKAYALLAAAPIVAGFMLLRRPKQRGLRGLIARLG